MSLFIQVIVMIVVFALLWGAIGYIPVPPAPAWAKPVLYVVLLLCTAYFLYTKFIH
jgi:hypothetical protein